MASPSKKFLFISTQPHSHIYKNLRLKQSRDPSTVMLCGNLPFELCTLLPNQHLPRPFLNLNFSNLYPFVHVLPCVDRIVTGPRRTGTSSFHHFLVWGSVNIFQPSFCYSSSVCVETFNTLLIIPLLCPLAHLYIPIMSTLILRLSI